MKVDTSHIEIDLPENWEVEISSRIKENDIKERDQDIHTISLKKSNTICSLLIESIEIPLYPFEDIDPENQVKPYQISEFVGRVRKCSFGDFSGVFELELWDEDEGEVIVKNYILTSGRLSLQVKARSLRSASKIDLAEAENILSSLKTKNNQNA